MSFVITFISFIPKSITIFEICMSEKLKKKLLLATMIISWTLFSVSCLDFHFKSPYDISETFANGIIQIFFSILVVSSYLFFRLTISWANTLNFTDLLRKVFITGLVTTLLAIGIRLFFYIFKDQSIVHNRLLIDSLYNVLVGLVIIYSTSTIVVWKRLILYQKSKELIHFCRFFQIALAGSLIYDFFGTSIQKPIAIIILSGFSIILIFNLKWIAYLNFKQKLKGVLFISLSVVYLYQFRESLYFFSEKQLVFDLSDQVFISGTFLFIFLYGIISVLVTLFNLPTSSVFEQKLKENINFRKLSQSIINKETQDQTYEMLLESSMGVAFAKNAWIETRNHQQSKIIPINIEETEIESIKDSCNSNAIKKIFSFQHPSEINTNINKFSGSLKHKNHRSILVFPIHVQDIQTGYLALLNDIRDAFNTEMINIIITFINQTNISLENITLLKKSLETERYKEQLKIAKTVQKSLLPLESFKNEHISMSAYYKSASEVGGDYYDMIQHAKTKFSMIIGDVSGKGTSAAFQMAQMKGIFHSLATQDISPKEFNKKANKVLSNCLSKGSFITTIFFNIDTSKQTIAFSRAGHCVPLFYSQLEKKVKNLTSDGMGLGILRNQLYNNYVYNNNITYDKEDILLIYTDGITEAKNKMGIQFDEERLKKSLNRHAHLSAVEIREEIINDLSYFIKETEINDDYTLVVIKFL